MNRDRPTWAWGAVWAAAMVFVAVVMPQPGGWTIDDSVKLIAAQEGTGVWAEKLPDGPVRSRLTDPEAFPCLTPPFAHRVSGGYALGFSPFTRALVKALEQNEWWLRMVIAASAVWLWVLMQRAGIRWAFLLLPLSFYAVVMWEHGLSWLLLWPAVWEIAAQRSNSRRSLILAGALAATAMLLRPETGLLVLVLAGFQIRRDYRRALTFVVSTAVVLGALVGWHAATSSEPLGIQLSLNLHGRGLAEWLASRPPAIYGLLIQMDRNSRLSWGMIAVFTAGVALILTGEKSGKKLWIGFGTALMIAWTAVYQFRLWSFPLPPLALLGMNSLVATLPWVVVLGRPPYRGRTVFWLACVTIGLALLLVPVWQGVHWGPRLLLFALPLAVLDLHFTNRARGPLFAILLGVTAVQTVSSVALAFARDEEVADRCRSLETTLGSPVVCRTTAQAGDLAPLWPGREFFTAASPRALRQLLIEFRRMELDTCWLHVEAGDPLYASAFPDRRPVKPGRQMDIAAGSWYRTRWQVYALALNRADTAWTGVLQAEAGALLKAGEMERALAIQKDVVQSSPQSAQTHHNLALIYTALGETNEARAEVQRALEIDPTLKEARVLWEELSHRTGNTPGAGVRRPGSDPGRRPD